MGMDIRNCRVCGSMFQYVGNRVCPKCTRYLEEQLQEVKAYIEEHKGATVREVSEEFDIPVKQIHRWVQEERLMFAPGVETGIVCQKCGIPIPQGTLCQKCAQSLKNGLNDAIRRNEPAPKAKPEADAKARMRLSRYDQSKK